MRVTWQTAMRMIATLPAEGRVRALSSCRLFMELAKNGSPALYREERRRYAAASKRDSLAMLQCLDDALEALQASDPLCAAAKVTVAAEMARLVAPQAPLSMVVVFPAGGGAKQIYHMHKDDVPLFLATLFDGVATSRTPSANDTGYAVHCRHHRHLPRNEALCRWARNVDLGGLVAVVKAASQFKFLLRMAPALRARDDGVAVPYLCNDSTLPGWDGSPPCRPHSVAAVRAVVLFYRDCVAPFLLRYGGLVPLTAWVTNMHMIRVDGWAAGAWEQVMRRYLNARGGP